MISFKWKNQKASVQNKGFFLNAEENAFKRCGLFFS